MHAYDQVAIVGVGLLGGSIGLAAKTRRIARCVVGIGRDDAKLDAAVARGIIDEATTNLAAGVQEANLVVICTPVDMVTETATQVFTHAAPTCLVTDVGSTKLAIVEAVERQMGQKSAQFVGSHPLAGDHRTGAEHARADLFEGRTVVITPTKATAPDATGRVSNFWHAVGADVVRLTPEEHDAAVAITSHLPHMVASALAAATPRSVLALTATGWADTTRVAAGDALLWRQIFAANRTQVLAALDQFDHHLDALRKALLEEDCTQLERLLAEGKQIRDAVGN
jgi:prephenate dehydrogenase